jgi:hypothetical protein
MAPQGNANFRGLIGQACTIIRTTTKRPMELSHRLRDRMVVDAGKSERHRPFGVELPALVTVGAEPVTSFVVIFIGKEDCDPIAVESPELLDEPEVHSRDHSRCRKASISARPAGTSIWFQHRLWVV